MVNCKLILSLHNNFAYISMQYSSTDNLCVLSFLKINQGKIPKGEPVGKRGNYHLWITGNSNDLLHFFCSCLHLHPVRFDGEKARRFCPSLHFTAQTVFLSLCPCQLFTGSPAPLHPWLAGIVPSLSYQSMPLSIFQPDAAFEPRRESRQGEPYHKSYGFKF